MKTALIIPIYQQKKYWNRMKSAIERLSDLPFCVYVMMDRPSTSDYNFISESCNDTELRNTYKVFNVQEIPEYVGRPNHLPEQELFLTGHRRNLAIEYAIEDGCDTFIFIDGDCLPQEDLIRAHSRPNSKGIPNLSVGRRREEKHGWKDQREISDAIKHLELFTRVDDRVIVDVELLKSSTITWSCNMSLNIDAVNRLKKFNNRYYGRSEVFHSDFLGTWGGEDGFIGIESNLCGVLISMISDKKSGIKHIEHPRPTNKYSGEAFQIYLEDQIELLTAMVHNSPMTVDMFS